MIVRLFFSACYILAVLVPADISAANSDFREEVIVTATRLPTAAKYIGSSVSVFTADDIQSRKVQLAADLLREVPGVAINRAGQTGAVTQARLRGAEGNHTLVMIDGIEANNPALGFEFNFADLMTHDIARVEVLRGPQSALYGSEAIGGVVSITTHEEGKPGFEAGGETQYGSFSTQQLAAFAAASSQDAFVRLSGHHYGTDGVSASAVQPERDGFESNTFHGKFGIGLNSSWQLRGVLRHVDSEVEVDTQDFDFPATPTQGLIIDSDQETQSSQLYGLLALSWRSLNERWYNKLTYAYVDAKSEAYLDGRFDNANEGQRDKIDFQSSLSFASGGFEHGFTVGAQYEEVQFENKFPAFFGATYQAEDDQVSLIAEYSFNTDALGFNISARHDDNDRFGDATTFRIAGAYLWEDSGTRLHASAGQGITNPSFFELFGFSPTSFVGNPDLDPEDSLGWDIGVEQSLLNDQLLLDVTYFRTDLEDEIFTTFDFSTFLSSADNLAGDSEREGVEVSLQAQLTEQLHTRASYSYLDAAEPDGTTEVRRPRHTASLSMTYVQDQISANVSLLYNGKQQDSEFIFSTPQSRVTLASYTLLQAAVSFDLTNRVQLFVRGDNLLDDDYVEVFGYRSVGRAGSVGLRAKF